MHKTSRLDLVFIVFSLLMNVSHSAEFRLIMTRICGSEITFGLNLENYLVIKGVKRRCFSFNSISNNNKSIEDLNISIEKLAKRYLITG